MGWFRRVFAAAAEDAKQTVATSVEMQMGRRAAEMALTMGHMGWLRRGGGDRKPIGDLARAATEAMCAAHTEVSVGLCSHQLDSAWVLCSFH